MAFLLRNGLAFCIVDRRPVFLDTGRNRYFLLRPLHEHIFLQLVTGARPSDEHAAADVARLLGLEQPLQPVGSIPVQGDAGLRPLEMFDAGKASVILTLRATARQICMERRMRHDPLDRLLGHLALTKGQGCALGTRQRELIAAHRRAGIVRTTRGRCLSTSLALARDLARTDSHPDVVIGVALSPFKAHCWLQSGTLVLNDHPDHVRAFTPILVI